ncbi:MULTISPECIES: MFS transporter [unclassified Arthrobacter]|uniref:MFS transporter n=1 Tax=unclassified Arthrobacter TaxID=235627 RepID=UPI001E415110|nr:MULTISPECIES: MFS transporter [unclassified Arthrobacter]MCC9144134.1 MFS transporter [Arthrobacter sp. zg-Y919]MDK1275359.1 MFS transporter [Arthrobacter sp. zg.Y919]WIB03253.1 MFS transporter [Arthrobacter sp. zg-Y919]
MEIKERIEASPMKRMQVGIVAICVALNMIDGFDVLVMAFSANAISEDWDLSGAQLGMLLSSALFGMAVGSILVAQVADIIGRQKTILICAIVISAGMFASAFAPSYTVLFILRFITGLAIGTMQASLNVFVSEYSSAKRRSTSISFYSAGQPIGGMLGGIIAGILISAYSWHAAFIFGGVVTLAMIPFILKFLPESLDYLMTRRPDGALDKTNRILARLDQPQITELPAIPTGTALTTGSRWKALFSGKYAATTVFLSIAFMMLMASFYFANSWTPKLVTASGFSAQDGIDAGVLFSLGAIIGSIVFGLIAARFAVKWVLVTFFVLAAGGFAVYAVSTGALPTALLAAALLGFLVNAGIAGMFSIGPVYYSSDVRATAVGFITGMGRVGAIISPIVAGALIDGGWEPGNLYFLFIVPMLVGGAAIACLRGTRRKAAGAALRGDTVPA